MSPALSPAFIACSMQSKKAGGGLGARLTCVHIILSSPTQFTESPHGKHSAKHTSPAGHLKSTHSSSIDAHSLKTSPGSATGCETTHANKDTSSDQRVDAPAFSPPAKRSRRMGPSLPSHLKAKSKSGSRQRDTHKDKVGSVVMMRLYKS